MSFWQTHSKEIVSILVPIIGALATYLLKPRAKLVWSITNSRAMSVQEQQVTADGSIQTVPGIVRTASIFLRNAGREAAENVEVVFNWRPPHINVWPQRDYSTNTNPDGRYILKFPDLASKEPIGLELLAVNSALPDIIQIRSTQQGSAKQIETSPQEIHSKFVLWIVLYLMIAGASATLYLMISIVQFFALIPA